MWARSCPELLENVAKFPDCGEILEMANCISVFVNQKKGLFGRPTKKDRRESGAIHWSRNSWMTDSILEFTLGEKRKSSKLR